MKSGSRLGPYEILEPLGVGGMGEVYLARDTRLGREVALKVLPAATAADPETLARFEREARSVASLNHPNIVTLYSVEDEGDTRFLTMELVDGEGLDVQVAQGPLPVDRVVEIGIALADALCAAHEAGIVHRDLKPSNVMLTASGRVKVLDFGLAKPDSAEPDTAATAMATKAAPLSQPGQVMGTVPYMAPEQIRGEPADARTDLFALGAVLYELATGRRPFEGATAGVISSAILNDQPERACTVRRDVPRDLDRVIFRCLEKDPRGRFQTALDVVNELRHLGQGGGATRTDEAAFLKPPPTPATPLLGREDDLETAIARIQEDASLLTVTGYGGTGKTRFAIELFARLAPAYPGGAAFISLAAVTAPDEVLPTVATALEIAETPGRSALEGLCTVIAERRVLLVLDNLEQVLDAAPDIAELSSRCPNLQIVATSRAPLKVGAETEFSLPPLALPTAGDGSLDSLLACPSVALFVQRAARVKSGFELSSENAEAITAICRRLDGLPLALELAAARVRILDPAKLLQRLDHALDLLTSGDRDLPIRQRTLRAAISWSYSLLEPDEQRLLRCCSVFHEGWTFESMERVCYGEQDRWRALDELESLVEKGLVRVDGSGERYGLLETIRAFSAEQLHAGGEVEVTRDAHARYFEEFMAEMAAAFRTPGQVAAAERVRADHANEMAAIRWLITVARGGDGEALERALLLCGHMNWFWHIAGTHLASGEILDEVLALAPVDPPSRGRALARLAGGMAFAHLGDWDRGVAEWRGGHEDGDALGDDELSAEGHMGIGYAYLSTERPELAGDPIERAIEHAERAGSDLLLGLSMAMKGMLLFGSGRREAGMEVAEGARRIQQRIADCEGGGLSASFLAQMHFSLGDLETSQRYYQEALDLFEAIGDRPEIARVYCEMGWTTLADDDVAAARHAFRRSVQVYEEVGSPRGTGLALMGLAAVDAADGRSERAVAIAAAAQALADREGVVCDHPMDSGLSDRIAELEESIPRAEIEGIHSQAETLSPAAVLAMLDEPQEVSP